MGFIQSWKQAAKRLKREILALVLAGRHPDTPWLAKILAALVAAYALSPIDLIPDFIPVLGYLDDLILLPLGLYVVIRLIPKEIMDQCRLEAERYPRPDRRLISVVVAAVIAIWLAAGYGAVLLIAALVKNG